MDINICLIEVGMIILNDVLNLRIKYYNYMWYLLNIIIIFKPTLRMWHNKFIYIYRNTYIDTYIDISWL